MGVFSTSGVFEGGVFSRSGVFDAPETPVDPLAGIVLSLRLQTHNGDNVPLGLYQDTACTVPATEAGDLIAAWRDEISDSGLTALQATEGKRPELQFVSGVPCVRNSSGKYLSIPSNVIGNADDQTIAVGAKISVSGFGGVITSKLDVTDNQPAIDVEPGPTFAAVFASLSGSFLTVASDTSPHSVVAIRDGVKGRLTYDGTLIGETPDIVGEPVSYATETWIGTYRVSEANYLSGDIYAIIAAPSVEEAIGPYVSTLLP